MYFDTRAAMKLEEVPRNYDQAARRYDLFTDIFDWILRTKEHRASTIDLLGELDGATVLDVGCGTGRNFPLLVPKVGERGKVIGFDYSEGMLAKARARIDSNGWSNVELVRGDAATLADVPDAVDAVVSVWCLGIVHDLEAALHRMVDVLRPGGSLAIMDFGRAHPDGGLLRWMYPVYSLLLRAAGIDTAEDLDDDRQQARWERGRQILQDRLEQFTEQRYSKGAGIILAGTVPAMTE